MYTPIATAASYYVDCVNGSNSNEGTSPSSAWKGLHSANSVVFNGGDSLLLKRGCTWEWFLQPVVTGPGVLTIDAYGNGAPPTIQGEVAVTGWSSVSGHANVYVATVNSLSEGSLCVGCFNPYRSDAVKINGTWAPCVGMNDAANDDNYCGPAAVGGLAALSAAAINNSWYYDGTYTTGGSYTYSCLTAGPGSTNDCGNLYVYSTSGAPSSVTAVIDGATQLIRVSGINGLEIQHIKLLNYSWYGIEATGASDNLTFANIYADTEVPFNFHGAGFYLHPTAASNIQLLNTEAHRGYYGYQFCQSSQPGCVTAATVTNCKAYFNRSAPISDQSGTNAVAYDYCHFYGNGVGSPTDVPPSGGTAGTHNIAPGTDPNVVSWLNYTPRMTLNFQKPGAEFGDDTALNAQLPALGGAPLSIGIATNYSFSTALISQFQAWITAGYDLNSLGLSATSYANNGTMTLFYHGTGTFAALTIAGIPAYNLAVNVSGAIGDDFSCPISSSETLSTLKACIASHPNFTVAWVQPCGSCAWIGGSAMLAQDLAAVTSATVPIAPLTGPPYTISLNVDQFLSDEAVKSKAWMTANLTFPGGHQWVYLYPGELFSPSSVSSIEGDITAAGYTGARGSISMQLGPDGLSGAFDAVASNGVDVQGLTTFSLGSWATLSPNALHAAVREAAAKSSVWGVPYILYWQPGFLSNTQLSAVISELGLAGVNLSTNSSLVSFLAGKNVVNSSFCSCYAWSPESGTLNFSPTFLSPTVGTGATLSGSYAVDVNGVPQPQTWSGVNAATHATVSKSGWDIGSQAVVPVFLGGLAPGR